MRAAAGLDRADPLGRQRVVAHQELGILLREDIVRDDAQLIAIAQPAAQRQQQRGLAAAHRPADADGERAAAVIAALRRRPLTEGSGSGRIAVVRMRVRCVMKTAVCS